MSEERRTEAWRRPIVLDVAIVAVLGVATEFLAWSGGAVGDHIAGPRALTAALPLLLAVPLLWRRTRPLLAWSLVVTGIVAQAVASRNSAEGLEIVGALCVGAYSVAAYGARRQALTGLGLLGGGYTVYALEDRNFRTFHASEVWATAFFALLVLAAWLIGAFVGSRRESARIEARASSLEREAELAVAAERGRVARELHDIVSHNLSVVVLQAAGAQALPDRAAADVATTLQKIESSGREALVEMRRMLGLLRAGDEKGTLAPQPGVEQLPALVDGVREAGLPVELAVDDRCLALPPVIGLSAYRIVQEALTNTLRHAGPARARVCLRMDADALVVEVTDDGIGAPPQPPGTAGHGLVGMRERVTLIGGELQAAPGPAGGFVVRARIPLGSAT